MQLIEGERVDSESGSDRSSRLPPTDRQHSPVHTNWWMETTQATVRQTPNRATGTIALPCS